MFPSLDIFKTDSDGQLLWVGASETFEAAKARIQNLIVSSPGEYLVFDQNTQNLTHVTPPEASNTTQFGMRAVGAVLA